MVTGLSMPCEIARKESKKTPKEKSMSMIGSMKINSNLDSGPAPPVSIFNCNVMVVIIAPIASPDAKKWLLEALFQQRRASGVVQGRGEVLSICCRVMPKIQTE